METKKVMPWGQGQGNFVVINAEDFNPNIHQEYGVAPVVPAKVEKKVEKVLPPTSEA